MFEYKKSSGILIFNNLGKLLLQLRASHDDSFPSHWDFAAGGGIDKNENEKQAAEREVLEELGIETKIDFIIQKHYTYPAWKPNATRKADLWIYKTIHNGPFTLDLNEIEKVAFFTLDEIKQMIQSGQKFHPEFILAWNDGIIS